MTRVIHTGDTHIGYQQYHSPARRRDFLDAFEQVVADAVDGDVDAVVHAGDLFHDRRPELRDLLGTLSALRRLADADVPFLAVVGNHESTRGGQWLDLFERLGLATRLGDEPTVVDDTAFYGLDFVPRSRRDDLDYDFAPHDAAHAALVAHGLFTPFAHADWDTETVLAESTVDFDALLLGDNHAPDTARVNGAWVTYCGSTERASAAERDGRGYNLVTFGAVGAEAVDGEAVDGEAVDATDGDATDGDATGDAVDIRRRALDTRPFVFVTADLGEGEGPERVRERVGQHDLTDAVVIVEVTGDGDPVPPAGIESFATEAGALVARVTDRRELDAGENGTEITFADPDEAVRERVAEMGLSTAARAVDETVRASKTADSNVRTAVRERVEDLLDDGTDNFAPAEGGTDADEPDGEPVDSADAAATDAADAESTDAGSTDVESAEVDPETPGPEAVEAATTDTTGDGVADEADDRAGDGPASDEVDPAAEQVVSEGDGQISEGDGQASEGDGQASMEEFL